LGIIGIGIGLIEKLASSSKWFYLSFYFPIAICDLRYDTMHELRDQKMERENEYNREVCGL
jgi:hypothetical protein